MSRPNVSRPNLDDQNRKHGTSGRGDFESQKVDPLDDLRAQVAWPDAAKCRAIRQNTLRWFDHFARDLPWRRTRDRYQIWISEIMLQQTQVATVIDYWQRFVHRFPDAPSLAAAAESEVLKLWEGLGYYRRARQAHAAAKAIVQNHAGQFPTTFEDVLALPGVGRYTAGAVLSIACDQSHPILEGNTIRLYARLLGLANDPHTTLNQKLLWSFAETLVPRRHAGRFNQGLMEIGGQVCKPQQPSCLICPLQKQCRAFADQSQQMIPAPKTNSIRYQDQVECLLVIHRRKKFLVRQCPPGERWAGLWDFVRIDLTEICPSKLSASAGTSWFDPPVEQWVQTYVRDQFDLRCRWQALPWTLKHAVTRFRIQLLALETDTVAGKLAPKAIQAGWRWVSLPELTTLPLNISARKFVDQVLH